MRAASRAPPRESPLFKTGRTTIWRTSAKTRTPQPQVGFSSADLFQGSKGVLYLLWRPAGDANAGRRTAHTSSEAAQLLVRSTASVAPLTCWVPSHVSRAAATATFLTRRSLVLAKHVSISLLLLFKLLRPTKARKAAHVGATPRDAGRDKTTAHKILTISPTQVVRGGCRSACQLEKSNHG